MEDTVLHALSPDSIIPFHAKHATNSRELIYCAIPRPSDFHSHFRLDDLARAILPQLVRHQLYVLRMPNDGLIFTVEQALSEHAKIQALAEKLALRMAKVLMTVYYSSATTPEMIEQIARSEVVQAVKYYPPHQGATTGSGHGIPLVPGCNALCAMEETGVPLLGHFESVQDKWGRTVPHHLRETYFMRGEFLRIREHHPRLRICIEHASTRVAVETVEQDTSGNTVMTATPQHLLFNCHDFRYRPSWANNLKCMPIIKDPEDQRAVVEFVTSGDGRAWAGTDRAPWPSKAKQKPFEECPNGSWTPHSTGLYARAFADIGRLDHRFARFMSLNGPLWWDLPLPTDTIDIWRETRWDIPNPTPILSEDGKTTLDVVIPLGWSQENDRLHVGFRCDAL